ncbi:hypothetical protein GCM10022416_60200 [Actinomadura keratinilytica]|jgi:hypothetical protein|uniref:Uncharacterized protein n=1 Tax=Actinomadura keratinilytica TaxID=547461 RepID=A0ABP7ZIG3_9ACTN
MPHRNAPLTEPGRLRLARLSWTKADRCGVPPNGSRSRPPPLNAGPTATVPKALQA